MSSSEDKKLEEKKIVIIGDSGVGKTSLLSCYLYNMFDENQESTLNATFATKKVKKENGDEIVLQLWDTAGQEAYKSIGQLFYKKAVGAIIVYDITNKKSFEEIHKFWYNQIKKNTEPGIKIAIVGNKFDKYINAEVTDEEGRTYAEKIGAIFQLTSAKDSKGVENLFEKLANALDNIHPKIAENENNIKLNNSKKVKKGKRKRC